MAPVRIDVLGTLRVRDASGAAVAVDGRVRRRLLALLVARRGRETRAEWLADALWDDHPPAAATATLQSHVAHLRRILEPGRGPGAAATVLRTVAGGYLLDTPAIEVDADAFVALVHRARAATPAEALTLVDEALALVRGGPYEDLGGTGAVAAESARLTELVLSGVDLRLELLGRLGRVDELRSAAATAMEDDPLREGPVLAFADALARSGRAPEALRALTALRRRLADETGLSPSDAVRDAEQRILQATDDVAASTGRVARRTPPPVRYARAADGVSIAYQVVGDGPAFVAVPPLAQNVEICWQDDQHRRLVERIAAKCTFVHFDKRGTGMSDRAAGFTLDERVGDFLAVLDAAGIARAVVCGVSEAGPLAIAFAAAHPERVAGLYLVNTFARVLVAPDHPIGVSEAQYASLTSAWEEAWGGDDGRLLDWFAPSRRGDREYESWLGHYTRQSCSPGTLAAINRANGHIDVRHLLGAIRTPTVVVHRTGDRIVPIAHGRMLAGAIPGARLLEVTGADHLPWIGDTWHEIADAAIALARASR